jgi:hypothetical protein
MYQHTSIFNLIHEGKLAQLHHNYIERYNSNHSDAQT